MGKAARGTRAYSDVAPKDAGAGASSRPARSMNLKGADPEDVAGHCLTVLYDEGGPKATPYTGVVVYTEKTRRCRAVPSPPASARLVLTASQGPP